jgi:K+-sensing histidine kinase KdpD
MDILKIEMPSALIWIIFLLFKSCGNITEKIGSCRNKHRTKRSRIKLDKICISEGCLVQLVLQIMVHVSKMQTTVSLQKKINICIFTFEIFFCSVSVRTYVSSVLRCTRSVSFSVFHEQPVYLCTY